MAQEQGRERVRGLLPQPSLSPAGARLKAQVGRGKAEPGPSPQPARDSTTRQEGPREEEGTAVPPPAPCAPGTNSRRRLFLLLALVVVVVVVVGRWRPRDRPCARPIVLLLRPPPPPPGPSSHSAAAAAGSPAGSSRSGAARRAAWALPEPGPALLRPLAERLPSRRRRASSSAATTSGAAGLKGERRLVRHLSTASLALLLKPLLPLDSRHWRPRGGSGCGRFKPRHVTRRSLPALRASRSRHPRGPDHNTAGHVAGERCGPEQPRLGCCGPTPEAGASRAKLVFQSSNQCPRVGFKFCSRREFPLLREEHALLDCLCLF